MIHSANFENIWQLYDDDFMNLSRRLEAPLSGTEMQHKDYKDTACTIYKALLRFKSLRDHVTVHYSLGFAKNKLSCKCFTNKVDQRDNHRDNADGNLKTRTLVKLFQPT